MALARTGTYRYLPGMPSVRIEFTAPEDFAARVDGARGHESRASFIKRMVDKAMGGEITATLRDGSTLRMQPAAPPAPPARASTSAQVKAGVKPIPKGGK